MKQRPTKCSMYEISVIFEKNYSEKQLKGWSIRTFDLENAQLYNLEKVAITDEEKEKEKQRQKESEAKLKEIEMAQARKLMQRHLKKAKEFLKHTAGF